jgi:hypothetical protein
MIKNCKSLSSRSDTGGRSIFDMKLRSEHTIRAGFIVEEEELAGAKS